MKGEIEGVLKKQLKNELKTFEINQEGKSPLVQFNNKEDDSNEEAHIENSQSQISDSEDNDSNSGITVTSFRRISYLKEKLKQISVHQMNKSDFQCSFSVKSFQENTNKIKTIRNNSSNSAKNSKSQHPKNLSQGKNDTDFKLVLHLKQNQGLDFKIRGNNLMYSIQIMNKFQLLIEIPNINAFIQNINNHIQNVQCKNSPEIIFQKAEIQLNGQKQFSEIKAQNFDIQQRSEQLFNLTECNQNTLQKLESNRINYNQQDNHYFDVFLQIQDESWVEGFLILEKEKSDLSSRNSYKTISRQQINTGQLKQMEQSQIKEEEEGFEKERFF
ncbi:hypothetical protein ABPG72_015480 [Tetrahymena utriculariae]